MKTAVLVGAALCLAAWLPWRGVDAAEGVGAAVPRTWVVGERGDFPTLSQALRQAKDGDTVALLPGTYRRDVAVITHKRLTLRGMGAERPVLLADGANAEGKAILVVRDGDIVIENLEFRGARASDHNGAGIRFERGRLTVRRCVFVDNETGLMSANFTDAELTIEDSVFGQGVREGRGLHHLLYVGRIASVSVRGSRFHDSATGHLFKSRAARTWLGYNLFVDGPSGQASYEVDLPEGGDAVLIGNVIAQGRNSENPIVVAYGAETPRWPRNRLRLAHNTLINEKTTPAWFLRVWTEHLPPNTEVLAVNNLTLGLGVFNWGARGRFEGNWPFARSALREPDALNFALGPDSWLRGRVDDPGQIDPELRPQAEFRLPWGTAPLAAPTHWAPGALQR